MAYQVPNTFVNNIEVADANQVNANFTYLTGILNSIVPTLAGADPTGLTDSAPAFAAAAAANPGGTVHVPPGVYLWNSAQTFTSPILFVGAGWNERTESPSTPEAGTWIKITDTAIAPITFTAAAAGASGFVNIAFEQAHPTPASGWAPTAYEPVITILGTGGTLGGEILLDTVFFYNIYRAISVPGTNGDCGRIRMSHISGQVFDYLFYGTLITDVVHADDFHIWPFWSSNQYVLAWQQANGIVIKLARCDGWQSDHIFLFGYLYGAALLTDANGVATNFYCGDLYADACQCGVIITGSGTSGYIGKLTTGGEILAGGYLPASHAYEDAATGTTFAIGRLLVLGCGGAAIYLGNPAGAANLDVGSCFIESFNQDNNSSPAILIASSSAFSRINMATGFATGGSNNSGPLATLNGNILTGIWLPFTPIILGSTGAGTATYSVQEGEYIILGNMITIRGAIAFSSFNGTGDALIGGLPFEVSGSALPSFGIVGSMAGITLDSGYTTLGVILGGSSTAMGLYESGSGETTTNLSVATLGAAATIEFEISARAF